MCFYVFLARTWAKTFVACDLVAYCDFCSDFDLDYTSYSDCDFDFDFGCCSDFDFCGSALLLGFDSVVGYLVELGA